MYDLIEIRPNRRVNITYIPHHNSDTTLFFLHGLGGRSDQWQFEIDYFKNKYSIVAADMLGHNKSDKPSTGDLKTIYSFAELAKDTQAIFDKYHSAKNIIIGHSYGGAFAADLAARNNTLATKLILIAPINYAPKNEIPKLWNTPVWLLEKLRPVFIKTYKIVAFYKDTDPQLIAQELMMGQSNPMYMLKSLTLGMREIPQGDLSKIIQPVLVMTSDHDKLVPAIFTRKFYKKLANVEFKIVDHASHMMVVEQPEQVCKLIEEFLK